MICRKSTSNVRIISNFIDQNEQQELPFSIKGFNFWLKMRRVMLKTRGRTEEVLAKGKKQQKYFNF